MRKTIKPSKIKEDADLSLRGICEYEGCDSLIVMTERLYGHKLTLCRYHGENIENVLVEGYNEFLSWVRDSLKPDARRRWRKRKEGVEHLAL